MRPKTTRRGFLGTAAATATGSWLAPTVRAAGANRLRAGAAIANIYVLGAKPGDVTADYHGHFADRLATLMQTDSADPPFVGIMARGNAGDTAAYPGGYTTWPTTSSCLEVDAEPKIRRELLRLLREVAKPVKRQ